MDLSPRGSGGSGDDANRRRRLGEDDGASGSCWGSLCRRRRCRALRRRRAATSAELRGRVRALKRGKRSLGECGELGQQRRGVRGKNGRVWHCGGVRPQRRRRVRQCTALRRCTDKIEARESSRERCGVPVRSQGAFIGSGRSTMVGVYGGGHGASTATISAITRRGYRGSWRLGA